MTLIQAYWKAYKCRQLYEESTSPLFKLGKLFERQGQSENAAAVYTEMVVLVEQEQSESGQALEARSDIENLAHAYIYLADHYMSNGRFDDAMRLAGQCDRFPEVRSEAKALIKQIGVLKSQAGWSPSKETSKATSSAPSFKRKSSRIAEREAAGRGSDESGSRPTEVVNSAGVSSSQTPNCSGLPARRSTTDARLPESSHANPSDDR